MSAGERWADDSSEAWYARRVCFLCDAEPKGQVGLVTEMTFSTPIRVITDGEPNGSAAGFYLWTCDPCTVLPDRDGLIEARALLDTCREEVH